MIPDDPCASDFPEFFAALWNNRPFCWQKELAERVLEREAASADLPGVDAPSGSCGAVPSSWPDAIALPTASGKTACMDVALFALAVQASRLNSGQPITAPRRIFFVVDRRVIVDEAHERARRLAEKLAQAEGGILKAVADDLRRIAHGATTRTTRSVGGCWQGNRRRCSFFTGFKKTCIREQEAGGVAAGSRRERRQR